MAEETQKSDDNTTSMEAPPPVDFYLLTRTLTIRSGQDTIPLDEHLTNVITEACAASRYHNKASKITLTLDLKPGSGYAMDVFPDVKSKIPEEKPQPLPMFADNDGALFLEDPTQHAIKQTAKFRTVRKDPKK